MFKMSYKVQVFDVNGKSVGEKILPESIFNDDNVNESLIHEFIVMQLANKRVPIAHTKTRGEVAYSGRKLYRQKWTGNARVGDAGSPIRRWGGVVFGPRNERNFSKDMPKKQRRKALFGALTLKAKDDEILAIQDFDLNEYKTKKALQILKNLNIDNEKVLIVASEKNDYIWRSFNNLPKVKVLLANFVNPYDLLTYKKVLFEEKAIDRLEEIFVK